jgi:NitT/TauT family transport system substrate-binding protein
VRIQGIWPEFFLWEWVFRRLFCALAIWWVIRLSVFVVTFGLSAAGGRCNAKGNGVRPITLHHGRFPYCAALSRRWPLWTVFLLVGMAWTAQAQPLERVTFGTNWVAQAEHGGFFQALADGTYKKYGLEVVIVPGGPNVNNRTQLLAGKLDFFMSANSLQSFDAVANNIPTVVVAASFQKDPQVFVAHPDVTKFEDLKTRTLFVSKEGMTTYFQWLKSEFGFSESKVKPYTSNAQPFLADKNSAMQGYVTSEPFAIERQAGFKPVVFLLADEGFDAYSTLIETRHELVEKKADTVQRFVDASAIGWYHYLYGDGRLGNELIKIQNPEMTDDLLAYSVDKMKEYGIVDSGDSVKLGIGAMSDAHWKSFFDKMVRAGVVKAGLDYKRAYTLQFVNKGVGANLRPKN